MNHFANTLLKNDDFNVYVLLLFCIIGFAAGFLVRFSGKTGKNKFLKMEKDAQANKMRIAELKERVEALEKENRELGGDGLSDQA